MQVGTPASKCRKEVCFSIFFGGCKRLKSFHPSFLGRKDMVFFHTMYFFALFFYPKTFIRVLIGSVAVWVIIGLKRYSNGIRTMGYASSLKHWMSEIFTILSSWLATCSTPATHACRGTLTESYIRPHWIMLLTSSNNAFDRVENSSWPYHFWKGFRNVRNFYFITNLITDLGLPWLHFSPWSTAVL